MTVKKEDDQVLASFPGPGYTGFGGSAGYHGSGVGGITGGYAGSAVPDTSWRPPPETRHDDRIREDVKSRLELNENVDASEIEVLVEAGEVTLQGSVETRHMKELATGIVESVPGVHDLHNRLHVRQPFVAELKELLHLERPHDAKR